MAFLLYKLIAPRPTFAQDMTEAESQIMSIHGRCWKELAGKGIAVLFGPVLDPKGAWGLAVIEVKDQADANSLGENDPAKANAGFRFETYPMPTTTLRK